ncbi:rod shape-determining protein MreC [Desulfitibacter alkalitolerans]|uniref:rod shape-determining protein MreC n=1 Tax=Desulfitibacter alkalitolerans TaxID=264641 RepID=UPI0004819FBF|nr:rod shape-determining protein MreC [Desulfitibacter alkalitolerans]
MARKISRKKSIIAGVMLVVILLAGIRFTATTNRTQLTQLEIILRDFIAPLYSGVMQVSSTIVNVSNSITLYNELLEENRYLKEQVRHLSLQNSTMEEYRLENQRLSNLLGFKETHGDQLNLVAAKVIGRNLGNWFDTIIINKGTNHGIRVNMAVINHQGLVGRVVATSRNTAEIMLLSDRESAVGSMVQRSRTLGVVESTTTGDYPLQMIHMTHDAPVDVGDVIITSGLGEIFPKGLKIGYVAEVKMAPTGLVKQAMVIPYVEFNKLEEVMVITEVKELPDDEELGEGEDH